MAVTTQTAPIFHGIKLAGSSAIENLAVSVVASDPAASIGGKLWVVDAVDTVSDQAVRYSYVDKTGAVQTATIASKADITSAVSTINSTTTTLTNNLNTEITNRSDADGTLDFSTAVGAGSGSDATELTALKATDNLTSAILAENARAVASEDDLQQQIADILSNTDPATLDSLSEIVAAYQLEDSNLQNSITTLAAARESALSTAMGSAWDEPTDTFTGALGGSSVTAELALMVTDYDDKIDQIEASAGLQTDGTLAFTAYNSSTMQIDFATDGVTTILGAIEAINNELKVGGSDALNQEIADRQAADGNLDFSGTTLVASDLTAAIIAEYNRATTKENALQTELDNTQASAGSAISSTGTWTGYTGTSYIDAATSMTNADELLDDQIQANATAITTETTNRTNADTALGTRIDNVNTATGISGDAYTADATSDYITGATSLFNADQLLDDQIKVNADGLATEITNRTSADTALGTRIDNVNTATGISGDAYTADATSDYITGATSLFNADQLLDDQIKVNATAISTETTNRTSADTALGTRIDNVNTAAGISGDAYTADATSDYITTATSLYNADQLLDDQIKVNADGLATEITNRTTAVSNEATARASADDQIEASVGLNADGTYQSFTTSNYLDGSTTIRSALSLLDAQLFSLNAAQTSTATGVQNELDATQTALGSMINATTGAYVAFSGTTYMDSATDVTGAMTALDAALAAEVVARKNDDADIIAAINAGNYYIASPAATTHTITHNLNSDQLIIQVLVDQGDGTYANDIVPIAIDSTNAFTVYLATSSAIRVSVLRMDDIAITVN